MVDLREPVDEFADVGALARDFLGRLRVDVDRQQVVAAFDLHAVARIEQHAPRSGARGANSRSTSMHLAQVVFSRRFTS